MTPLARANTKSTRTSARMVTPSKVEVNTPLARFSLTMAMVAAGEKEKATAPMSPPIASRQGGGRASMEVGSSPFPGLDRAMKTPRVAVNTRADTARVEARMRLRMGRN